MAQSIQIKKISPWMERLADFMIANPEWGLTELSVAMGRGPGWVCIVKNSDIFMDYFRKRSDYHSEQVTDAIKMKAFAASELALDEINRKLEDGAASMTTDQLLAVVDVTAKRFGYGESAKSAPQLNVNLGFVTAEQLAEAREKLRMVEQKVIDLAPANEVGGDSSE